MRAVRPASAAEPRRNRGRTAAGPRRNRGVHRVVDPAGADRTGRGSTAPRGEPPHGVPVEPAGQEPTKGNPKYGVWPMATNALAPRSPGLSTSVQSEVDFES